MKRSLILSVVLAAAGTTACHSSSDGSAVKDDATVGTSLSVPLRMESDDGLISAVDLNARLAAAGAELLPERLIFTAADDAGDVIDAAAVQIEAARAALDLEYLEHAYDFIPGANDTPTLATCFTGEGSEVINLVGGLIDLMYSDQYIAFGWKHLDGVEIYADDVAETDAYLRGRSSTWRDWSTTDDRLLILASTSDSGDDVNESLLPRCQ